MCAGAVLLCMCVLELCCDVCEVCEVLEQVGTVLF